MQKKNQQVWESFIKEVDNVDDLTAVTQFTLYVRVLKSPEKQSRKKFKVRADIQDPEDTLVIPEESYLPCYTAKDLQALQMQDADLLHLQDWMDNKEIPTREEVASLSPAIRKSWLNAENLVQRNGVIYRTRGP